MNMNMNIEMNTKYFECQVVFRQVWIYQITQWVINIMALDKDSKNMSSGLPCSAIFPSVMPSTVAKTTKPMMFVPDTLFCTGSQ